MLRLTRFLLALVFFAALSSAHAEDELALRRTLEKIYHDWRSAVINKSMETWRRTTTSYRQVLTYNLIVSGGQTFPDAIFDIPIQPPDLAKLRLLEVQAVGPTAHLVYFGKVDLGLETDEVPENVIVLKFFMEKGEWRFDSNKLMNLSASPDVRSALAAGGKPDFLDQPAFTPSGIVPPTPKQCRKPQYSAVLQIQSYGYETKASMSGYDYAPVADDAEQQLIIGGLVMGKNDLHLTIKPIPVPEGGERFLEVNAVLINGKPDKPQVRVFSWETKLATPPAEIDLPVYVTGATLRGI